MGLMERNLPIEKFAIIKMICLPIEAGTYIRKFMKLGILMTA